MSGLEKALSEVKFQRAPTLGGECYRDEEYIRTGYWEPFQRAPTLGGECYALEYPRLNKDDQLFQRAPTLGGECYALIGALRDEDRIVRVSTGTHPWG